MKKTISALVLGLTLFCALNASGKGYGWIQVFNGSYNGNGYSVSYCSSLLMISYSELGIPGDSTDWFLNGEMISRTYNSDTFRATEPGLYTTRMYEGWGNSAYTIGPGWYCPYGGGCDRVNLTVVAPCPSPSTGFSTTSISSSKATLNWNTLSCAVGYKIRYRVDGTSNWSKKSVNGNNGLKKLTQLSANTTYQWGIRTKCAEDPNVFSNFSATQTFTTADLRDGTEQSKSEDELIVYPNPSAESIFIGCPKSSGTSELKIMNYLGQTVIEKLLDAGTSEPIIISSLPSGNYFIVLRSSDIISTGEFIKK